MAAGGLVVNIDHAATGPADDACGARRGSQYHAALPSLSVDGATVTLLIGELGGVRSPALVHTPLIGAEDLLTGPGQHRLPLDPGPRDRGAGNVRRA